MRHVPRVLLENGIADGGLASSVLVENQIYRPPLQTLPAVNLPAEPGLLVDDDKRELYWNAYDFQELADGE